MTDIKTVIRYDAPSPLEKYKTDNGFLRVKATVGRIGVLQYKQADGSIRRELRHPDEVFADASLESLKQVPVTLGHPVMGQVSPANVRRLSVGTAGELPLRNDNLLQMNLVVQDVEAIEAIDGGTTQISPGYFVQLDYTPGEYNGERYDAIQRNIRYNHVAIVAEGRAGPDVRLHLDSTAVETTEVTKETPMAEKKLKQDEKAPVEKTETVKAAPVAEARDDSAEVSDLKKQLVNSQARLDVLEAELAKEKQLRSDAASPERIKEAVAARLDLERKVTDFFEAGTDLSGKSDNELRVDAVKAAHPSLASKVEAYSDEELLVAFDLVLELSRESGNTREELAEMNKDIAEAKNAAPELTAEAKFAQEQLVLKPLN